MSKHTTNMQIQFSIGPSNALVHNIIIQWLRENNYTVEDVSFDGDHHSEILVTGDYDKCFSQFKNQPVSFEYWDQSL